MGKVIALRYATPTEASKAYRWYVRHEMPKDQGLSIYNVLVDGVMPTIYILAPDDWPEVNKGGVRVEPVPEVVELLAERRARLRVEALLGNRPMKSDTHYEGGRRLMEDGGLDDR